MDILEKDERMLEIEARMYAPLEWDSPAICKILDLKEQHYEETLRLIKHHFFSEEPMCKSSSLLKDHSSVNEYLDLVRTWMKDTTSLIAVSRTSGRVIGTAITRISSNSEKIDTYNRMLVFEGATLDKIMRLQNTLIRETNAYEKLGHDTYFRVYILCVHPSYRKKGVGRALLQACTEVAKTLEISAIGGVFTSGVSQSLALTLGFQVFHEIKYSRWVQDNHVIFDDPGRGNYSAAFMGMVLPKEIPEQQDST